MALPPITERCTLLDVKLDLCVQLPGGASLCAQPSVDLPQLSLLNYAKQLMSQANSALAPLEPVFLIMDILLQIKKCIDAFPDALGPPPNPTKIAQCIPELGRLLAQLAEMLPQAAVPKMISGLLDVLIAYVQGLQRELQAVADYALAIDAARRKAADAPALDPVITCSEENLDLWLANINDGSLNVARFIDLLNAFTSLVGLPQIPTLCSAGRNVTEAAQQLDRLVILLQEIRAKLPSIQWVAPGGASALAPCGEGGYTDLVPE